MRRVHWLLILCLLVGAPLAARAQTDARRLYEDATKAYNLGEFTKAIDLYKKAYELKSDPVLLYNIAQANRLANNLDQAVFFYRSYLRNSPDAPNRGEVEGRIATLEKEIAERRSAALSAPPNSPVPIGQKPTATSNEPPPVATTTSPTSTQSSSTLDLTAKDTSTAPAHDETPVYKKWWLWTIVAAVVVVAAVGIGVGVAAGGGGNSAPDSIFGTRGVF